MFLDFLYMTVAGVQARSHFQSQPHSHTAIFSHCHTAIQPYSAFAAWASGQVQGDPGPDKEDGGG